MKKGLNEGCQECSYSERQQTITNARPWARSDMKPHKYHPLSPRYMGQGSKYVKATNFENR